MSNMRRLILFLVAASSPSVAPGAVPGTVVRRERESSSSVYRPFPYLTYVRFSNEECATDSGFAGTCYTPSECSDLKGLSHGTCADGYGICCFMTYTCRETVHHNVSYFVPPSYPDKEKDANLCPLKIALEPNICQVRLDFNEFDLLGPREGDCVDDMFVVTGGNANHRMPVLCGDNTGQHIYIDVDTVEGPLELQMITGISNYARDWRIKISMVPCESLHKAPEGCLQFYTGIKGYIRSFNFNQRNETRLGYLNGADYAICLRRERDMCSITYSVRTASNEVELSPDGNDTTPYGAPEAVMRAVRDKPGKNSGFNIASPDSKPTDFHSPVGAGECEGDYLSIPGLDRFCGGTFSQSFGSLENQSITVKNAGPLIILFRSDKAFNGRGFNINFHQGPCTPLAAQAFF